MAFKGFFIDDTEEERIYASLLSTRGEGGLKIEYRPVSEAATLAGELFESRPDIVALDFRLDENPSMINPKHAYNGSGLAQLLRDKATLNPEYDFPIVLISSEEKYERFYKPDGTAHDLFDRTYGKVATSENAERVKSELISLCEGYQSIKVVWGDKCDRFSIFELDDTERDVLVSQELRTAISSAGAPHIAARFILRGIIDRPGILLSDREMAARLGVADIGGLDTILIEKNIQYKGVFNKGWRRWWAHRFETLATEWFGQRPTNMLGSERFAVLKQKFKFDLTPARSTWNGSLDERFAFSCLSCDRPGEIRHSVAAFDPTAPRFSHRRRICWDCIQTGKYKEMKLDVEDIDLNIVADVLIKARERDAAK